MSDWYSWYAVFMARETDMLIRLKHPRAKRNRPRPVRNAALHLPAGGHPVAHLIGPGGTTGCAQPRSVPRV